MRKLLVIVLILLFLPTLAWAIPEPYEMLKGNQMIPTGAPWISDNSVLYFGTGKDAAISYNSVMDKFYLNDTPLYLEEATTFGGATNFAATNFVGAVTTTSTIKAGGTVTAANVADNGTLTVGGATNLVGAVSTTSTIDAGGKVRTASLTNNGTSNLIGAITTTAGAQVGGTLQAAKIVNNGTTNLVGVVTTTTDVSAGGTVSGAKLKANGTSNLVGVVTTTGAAQVGGTLSAANVASNGTLTVGGASNAVGAVTTTTTAKFGGAVSAPSVTVNSTNGLVVNGKIIGDTMTVALPIFTAPVDIDFWTAPFACKVIGINETHITAQNTAFPNTGSVTVEKASNAQGAGAGTILHNATMYLNSTADTYQAATLNAATGATTLAKGQHLVANFNGTVTTYAGGSITVELQRL